VIGRRSGARPRPIVPAVAPRQDAAGRRIDALARELAAPLSRRHALGVLGAATAAAMLPGAVRPGRAAGQGALPQAGGPQCGHIRCIKGATCCPAPEGGAGQCCLQDGSMECREGWCEPTGLCPGGVERCGTTGGCCPDTTECIQGHCRGKCGTGETRCGTSCCGKGEKCEDGRRCVRCKRGEEPCGDTCCAKGQFCCDPEKGLCCEDKKATCCYDSETERGFCCEKPAECAREIDGLGGAIRPDAKRVCCPQPRVVPFTGRSGCCPAGTVSMGGALIVLPGGGDGGFCCREKYKCGDTCCANNRFFKQVCHKGRCVDPKSDAPVRGPAGR
jgi:hypothetical protein